MRDIAGGPIGTGVRLVCPVSGLHEDRSHARVPSAADIARLISDQERAAQIETMIALRFEDHARPGLASDRIARGQIGAMITRIDQAIAELALELRFNGSIFGFTEI